MTEEEFLRALASYITHRESCKLLQQTIFDFLPRKLENKLEDLCKIVLTYIADKLNILSTKTRDQLCQYSYFQNFLSTTSLNQDEIEHHLSDFRSSLIFELEVERAIIIENFRDGLYTNEDLIIEQLVSNSIAASRRLEISWIEEEIFAISNTSIPPSTPSVTPYIGATEIEHTSTA